MEKNHAPTLGVVIVAGGNGNRLGSEIPKQFLMLQGKPVLQWSIDCFVNCAATMEIVVTLPVQWLEKGPDMLKRLSELPLSSETTRGEFHGPDIRFVQGGEQRQDSVLAGISKLNPQIEWVAIHDGARPGITPDIVNTAFAMAQKNGSAVCAIPCPDTIVEIGQGRISSHLERANLMLVQTPQIFRRETLMRAFRHAKSSNISGTDDSRLVMAIGEPVFLAPGALRNRKVTTMEDLALVGVFLVKP